MLCLDKLRSDDIATVSFTIHSVSNKSYTFILYFTTRYQDQPDPLNSEICTKKTWEADRKLQLPGTNMEASHFLLNVPLKDIPRKISLFAWSYVGEIYKWYKLCTLGVGGCVLLLLGGRIGTILMNQSQGDVFFKIFFVPSVFVFTRLFWCFWFFRFSEVSWVDIYPSVLFNETSASDKQ